ncbi:MAG: DUF2892 domain-containing protein [Bacteroidales bacterium]|nr:DUF2892 domain-containing protein [Bacteroidales bacterium]
MKTNVGKVDIWIRIILGVIIIALGIYYQNWWGVVGVLPLLTAFIRWCPLYLLFGITTCKEKTKDA